MGTTKKTRRSSVVLKNPTTKRRHVSNVVRVSCGGLALDFLFPTVASAKDFIEAGSRSSSVDGLSLLVNGRFKGGRDGGAS